MDEENRECGPREVGVQGIVQIVIWNIVEGEGFGYHLLSHMLLSCSTNI